MSEQLALFSDDAAAPRGLRYQPSFITAQSEQELIAQIRALPLAPFQFGAFEGKRRVASFGWRYDYSQHKLEQAEDLPAWIQALTPGPWGNLRPFFLLGHWRSTRAGALALH